MKTILTAMLAALVAAALLPATTQAQPGNGNGSGNGQGRDEVVRYWTPDRVAKAKPRDVSPDRKGGFEPSKGPNKPGGGGGGSTATTGAHWTKGGKVFATTGKVLFTMAGVDYVCSGSVVNDRSGTTSLVLTAGHCAADEEHNGAFATNWMFVPAYETGGSIVTNLDGTHSFACDTTPYGCWTATSLVTTTAWANGNGSLAAFNNDFAFAVVGGGGKTGESKQLDGTVGSNGIAFGQTQPAGVYAFGYPQAPPYSGQSLTYCAGNENRDTWGGTSDYGLNCNMTGGSSGGPWFLDFSESTGAGTLASVNSFKYTSGPFSNYMFGPSFGAYAQRTYDAALGATGNTTVN